MNEFIDYAYGWLDKVLSVTENGKPIASFNYHNDGQIAQAIHNGRSEDFLWDGLALIHRGETSFINEPYVTDGNPILSSKDGVMFNDMLGSTLNIGGKAVNMTAFGESANPNAMYTGKPYIGELGYAFLFRNYRSDYGKWQTADPIGYPDGWNNLAYCGNYPGMAIDRDGALWSWGAAGIGAAIGAVTNVAAYVASTYITGGEITAGGLTGAATSGAISGGLIGGALGTATGDPSALIVAGVVAFGVVGGASGSVFQQLIDNGTIDPRQFVLDSVVGGVSNLAGMGLASYLNFTTNVGIAFSETLAGIGLNTLNNLITNMYKAFSQAFDNIEQKLNNARGE